MYDNADEIDWDACAKIKVHTEFKGILRRFQLNFQSLKTNHSWWNQSTFDSYYGYNNILKKGYKVP